MEFAENSFPSIRICFGLFHSEQSSYKIHLGRMYLSVFTHSTLAFSRFFCKDVAFERFLESDFSGTGNFKALFCAAVCFYLWHYYNLLMLLPAGAPKMIGNLWSHVGNV